MNAPCIFICTMHINKSIEWRPFRACVRNILDYSPFCVHFFLSLSSLLSTSCSPALFLLLYISRSRRDIPRWKILSTCCFSMLSTYCKYFVSICWLFFLYFFCCSVFSWVNLTENRYFMLITICFKNYCIVNWENLL